MKKKLGEKEVFQFYIYKLPIDRPAAVTGMQKWYLMLILSLIFKQFNWKLFFSGCELRSSAKQSVLQNHPRTANPVQKYSGAEASAKCELAEKKKIGDAPETRELGKENPSGANTCEPRAQAEFFQHFLASVSNSCFDHTTKDSDGNSWPVLTALVFKPKVSNVCSQKTPAQIAFPV